MNGAKCANVVDRALARINENKNTVQLTVRIRTSTHNVLKKLAEGRGASVNEIVSLVLDEALDAYLKEKT